MKKIIIIIAATLFAMPAFSVCSITGEACSAESNFDSKKLQRQFVPDHLKDMQRTDAFQKDFVQPYDSKMINTTPNSKQSGYDANCQFGVCIPGPNTNTGAEE